MLELNAKIDLNTSVFPQSEIAELLDVSPDTLRTWVKRGRLVLSSAPVGRGKERRYSFVEAIRVGVLYQISQTPFPNTFADDFADWLVSMVCARQANGLLFGWEEKFAIFATDVNQRLSESSVSDEQTGVSHWDHWGLFYSETSELEDYQTRQYAEFVRSKLAAWTDDGLEWSSENIDRETPLTVEEYRIAAINGAGPMPPKIILDVGYIVNYLAVNLFPDVFGPPAQSSGEIR